MSKVRWLTAGFVGIAAGVGCFAWLAREEAGLLRAEITTLQVEARELARLRAENVRLKGAQPSAEDVARLRSDHAAVQRLRQELERLRADVEARERALAAPLPPRATPAAKTSEGGATAAPRETPALLLPLAFAADGALSLEDKPTDFAQVRQRIAALAPGELFEVRVRLPERQSAADMAPVQRAAEQLKQLADERGLRMRLKIEPPSFTTSAGR